MILREENRYLLWLYTDKSFRVRSGILYDSQNCNSVKKWMKKVIKENPNYKDRVRIEKRTTITSTLEED